MSGVAKDETTSTPATEPAASAATPETLASPATNEADSAQAHAVSETDSQARTRRTAPHLRVVSENEVPSAQPEAPGMRTGPMMRAERERQGLSLEQVSRETRVTVSHLRAIEEMTPNLIGEPVYVKGHIRTYARHLKLDPDDTVVRYLRESAILADPEKQEIAPPVTARKLPMALPVLGMVVVALVAGSAVYFVVRGGGAPPAPAPAPASEAPQIEAAEGPTVTAANGPVLRIVALRRARIEVPKSFQARSEPIRNPVTDAEHRMLTVLPDGWVFHEAESAAGFAKSIGAIKFDLNRRHSSLANIAWGPKGLTYSYDEYKGRYGRP